MRLCEIRIEADRLRHGLFRKRSNFAWICIAVHGTRGVSGAETGPCEGVVVVDVDRMLVLLLRLLGVLGIPAVLERSRSKIVVERVATLCLPALERAEAIRRDPELNLLGDIFAELLLQPQQAGQLTLVGVRPYVLLIPDPNQSDGDAQSITLSLNGAVHEVVHRQFPAYLAERQLRALVALRSTLDAKVREINLRERCARLLGESIGQVVLIGILPEVL